MSQWANDTAGLVSVSVQTSGTPSEVEAVAVGWNYASAPARGGCKHRVKHAAFPTEFLYT